MGRGNENGEWRETEVVGDDELDENGGNGERGLALEREVEAKSSEHDMIKIGRAHV